MLRPGNAPDRRGAIGILKRVLARLRKAFPKARFFDPSRRRLCRTGDLRLPGRADRPGICGRNGQERRFAATLQEASQEGSETLTRVWRDGALFGDCRYAAKTWSHKRRVVIKAEVVRHPGREAKDNPRFVVTNLTQTPKWIYKTAYCGRGEIENRIKELHHGLEIGRTSCTSFWANQLRVFLTAAAYVLMQELRLRARRTDCSEPRCGRSESGCSRSARTWSCRLAASCCTCPRPSPSLHSWNRIALSLGARAG